MISREDVRKAIGDELTDAAMNGDQCARYGDWSGPSDEDKLIDLIVRALEKIGIFA